MCGGTGHCHEKISASAPEPVRPQLQKPALATPATSTIAGTRRRNAIAPLTIKTGPGDDYLVKFANVRDSKNQTLIYVRGGQSYSTKLPLGRYHVRVAAGREWYGRNELFGANTRFFRLRAKGRELQVLEFRREGNKIIGMILSFQSVADGNMEQERISRSEFDKTD